MLCAQENNNNNVQCTQYIYVEYQTMLVYFTESDVATSRESQ